MKNIYGGVIDLYLQDRDPLQCVHSPPWQPGPKPPPEHTDQEMFRSSLKVRTDCSASGSEDTITLNIPWVKREQEAQQEVYWCRQ
jgi:hypothetical protein